MTDWPKMESMVTISDAYFTSENFKDLGEITRQGFLSLSGVPLKVISLCVFLEKHLVGVTNGAVDYSVPLEYIDPVESETEDDNKPTSEEAKPAKAVEEKAVFVSFPFTDDSRVEDALLFFARNGYKVWVEDTYHNSVYIKESKLNVEMPKERM